MRRVYLSGPISGKPNAREDFDKAEAILYTRPDGDDITVVNPFKVAPHTHDGPCPAVGYAPGEDSGHTSSCCYMRTDLRALLDCDEIALMPGWTESRGARLEYAVAHACGMEVSSL